MKLIMSVILASWSFAAGAEQEASLPPEVISFVAERDTCDHFGGEEDGSGPGANPEQLERQKFVNESIDIYCAGTDRRLAALRSRYSKNTGVMKRLGQYETTVEPGGPYRLSREVQMPDQQKPGAVLFAKDVAAVAKFYAEIADLAVTLSEAALWVLESANFQLVIHGIPQKIAASITISSPPSLRTDMPTKLILPVASIAAARAKAAAFGGGVNPKRQEFEARGFRACDGYDPEGNIVQFRENAGVAARSAGD